MLTDKYQKEKKAMYVLLLPIHCFTCWKQAFVRSPSNANELCLTSGIGSCTHTKKEVKYLVYIMSCTFF